MISPLIVKLLFKIVLLCTIKLFDTSKVLNFAFNVGKSYDVTALS